MAATPRYAIAYGDPDSAVTKLDTLIMGGWAPNLDAIVSATRTFAYQGGYATGGFVAHGTIVIPDNSTKFVQRTEAGVVSADAALDVAKIPMAVVTTLAGVLTNFEDIRDLFFTQMFAALRLKVTNPMTGLGDLIFGGISGAPSRLPPGADGKVLKLVAGAPAWDTGLPDTSGIPDGQVITNVAGVPEWQPASAGSGGGDPFASFVIVLPLLEGANGQTAITERTPFGSGWVASGGCALSNTRSKFGTTSLFLGTTDQTNALEKATTNAQYDQRQNIGAGPFTFECFHYRVTGPQTGLNSDLYFRASATSNITREFGVYVLNYTVNLYYGIRGVSNTVRTFTFSSVTLPDATWNHIAITRDELGLIRCFVGGVFLTGTTFTDNTDLTFAANKPSCIGGLPQSAATGKALNCWMDQLRITKGVCRYRDTFAPPTSPFVL